MKSFLLIACLLASASCFSQIMHAPSKGAYGNTFMIHASESYYIALVNKDTVELPAAVHYIKVDGKIYEIKRNTSIQEVQPPFVFPQRMQITPFNAPTQLIVPGDTSTIRTFRINTYVRVGPCDHCIYAMHEN